MSTLTNYLDDFTRLKQSQQLFTRWLHGTKKNPSLGSHLDECGSFLKFRTWLDHDCQTTISKANFCKKSTVCQTCARRRGLKYAMAYHEKITYSMSKKASLRAYHVTLTIKNTETALEGFKKLKMGYSRMMAERRRGLSSSNRNKSIEWCKVVGGVKALEATKKDKGWHPHMHILCLVEGNSLDKFKLSEEWNRFTGDSFIVHISSVDDYAKKRSELETELTFENALTCALLEVLKYPTKFESLTFADRYEFWQTTKNFRLLDSFGCLRGIPEIDLESDDDLSGEYIEHWAIWNKWKQSYRVVHMKNTQTTNEEKVS